MADILERLKAALVNRYAIERELGAGGMATVYLAVDLKHDRQVAVKVLRPELAAALGPDRFRREIRIAASLSHPHILALHDSGEAQGLLYYVMPYLDGESLRERLERERQLPVGDALEIAHSVAAALAYAHRQDIVHRDIKPENILLHEGEAMVADFGIGKALSAAGAQPLTQTGIAVGTPAYMSPEQATGEHDVDGRSDIYSLGCVLYEMLAGEPPYTGPTAQAIIAKSFADPIPGVRRVRDTVPKSLDAALKRALAKVPADRFATASEFAEAMTLSQEPSAALHAPAAPISTVPSEKAQPRALSQRERRHATILLSRLTGYAAMVEELDPQDLERTMSVARRAAEEVVNKHGGVVNRFVGDEMEALFGVPTTHEDDALRGVRAAMDWRATVAELSGELEQRTGCQPLSVLTVLHTGSLVIQATETGEAKFQVVGSTVQVVSQLLTRAEAGEILVSPESQRVVAPFFETEAVASLVLRDAGQTMIPYRVLRATGLQTRLEAAELVGLSPFTGRHEELQMLTGCLDHVLGGQGELVTVVGEAGVGKSRLHYEFRRALDKERVQLVESRCHSYRSNVPYLPLIEALKDCLQLWEGAPGANLADEVARRAREIDPRLEEFVPLYLHLLSIHSDSYPTPNHLKGEDLRFALFEGLCAIFTQSAARGPVVMLLEDWHWADDASHDVLKQLVGMLAAYPILVVVTYRPERMRDWGAGLAHTTIHLGPLEVPSSITIMKSVLGIDEVPEELSRIIHERTGGNPFFLEEICQGLQEAGVLRVEKGRPVLTGSLEQLPLPDSVQSVIRTRLDRLDEDACEVIRLASVVGREFTRRILECTLPKQIALLRSLETLQSLGLVQQIRVLPEAAYRFKSALTHEVAYDSLLRHQRKTSHAVVGDALEALYPNRIEEHLDLLVHHFSRAENWMKAVRYGREAATKAGNQGQFAQALGMLEEVDSWLRKLPTDADQRHARIDVLFEMERLQETVGARDRQQALIDELHTLVDRVQDRPYMAKVYLRQGELGTLEGRFAEGEQALEKSASISRELSDTAGERNALRTLGFLRWQQGRQEEAMAANEAALAIDRANDDRAGIATDLCNMAAVLRSLGDHERALACLTEAVDIIESSGETVHLAYALQVASNVYRDLGQTGEALKHLHQTLEIERRYRLFLHQPVTLNSIASAYWEQSKHDESLSVYRELVELTRDTNNRRELASALETLSQCLLILAKHEEALPYLKEGAEVFGQLGDLEHAALMLSRVAGVHERSAENLATAEETWMETRNLRRQCNDKAGELEAMEAIARLRRKRARDPYEAVPYYLEALELAGDIGDRAREGELLNTIGILEWDASRFDEALTFYERALGIYRELDDQVHLGLILNSLGVTLKQLHRYEDAVARLEEALQVHRQTKERLLEAHAMAALGDVFSDIGDHDRAIDQYQASLEIRRAIGDQKGQGWMLHYLARVQASQGLEQQARANSANALGIAEECRDEKLREACRGLPL